MRWWARKFPNSVLLLQSLKLNAQNHDAIGFRYWRNPGPFAQVTIENGAGVIPGRWGQFLAFWNVFVQAAFSFIGTEIIATTLGEAENPRKTVPRAIKQVFFRYVFYYRYGDRAI